MEDLFGNDILELNREKKKKGKRKHRRTTALFEIEAKDEYRKAFGVTNLLKVMGLEKPKLGHSYHIISGGNVDLLCHLRWIMLHWDFVDEVFISAWSISNVDILLLNRWHEDGKLGKISLVVGDTYASNYLHEWNKLYEMYNEGIIDRLFGMDIHSKLLLARCGEEGIVVESSANCNMNPRYEQSSVIRNRELYDFYVQYFDDLFEDRKFISTNKQLQKLEIYEQSDLL